MIKTDNFSKVQVASVDELRRWLKKNHKKNESVWLVTFKKNAGEKYVSIPSVLDELLCFGWIDGIRRKMDETRTMQLISPRKAEHWAASYKTRAARLIKEGRMQPSGLRCIELAKKNGQWNVMNDVDQLIVPKDLKDALRKMVGALEFFNAINNSSKRFVLRWIKIAKTEKTRTARIAQIVALSAKGEKLKGS